jgi:tetratricopeptide (TPR) repeat protein
LQGSDFSSVEKTLKQYLPTLEHVAQKPSLSQQAAARLAAQGKRFLAILAVHRLDVEHQIQHYIRAVDYSRLAEDANLQATMLNNVGIAYAKLKQPEQAMRYYQEA